MCSLVLGAQFGFLKGLKTILSSSGLVEKMQVIWIPESQPMNFCWTPKIITSKHLRKYQYLAYLNLSGIEVLWRYAEMS